MKKSVVLTAASGLLMMALSNSALASNYKRDRTYSVTITNITKATQFTPIAAASHTRAIALFELPLTLKQALQSTPLHPQKDYWKPEKA